MTNKTTPDRVYTPEQVADMLQLSKNTVYELIGKGEIVAKRFGRVYRVPASSLAFMFGGINKDSRKSDDFAVASEEAFAKDWLRPEDEETWKAQALKVSTKAIKSFRGSSPSKGLNKALLRSREIDG